jgi:hypothetical protein
MLEDESNGGTQVLDEDSIVFTTHAFPETTSYGCSAETDGYKVESVYSYNNDVYIALDAVICQDVAKLCREKGVSHFTVCLSGDGQPSKDVAIDMSLVVMKIIPGLENATVKSPSSTISEIGEGSNFDPSLGDKSEHCQDTLPSSAGGEHDRFIGEVSSNGFSSSKNMLSQATNSSIEIPAQRAEMLTRCPCGRYGGLHTPSRLNEPHREEGEDSISQCDDSENMQNTLDAWRDHNRLLKAIPALPQIDYGAFNRSGPPSEDDVSHADAQRLISFSYPVRNVGSQELEGRMFPSNHGEIRASRLLETAPPETAPSRLSTLNLDMTNSSFEMNMVMSNTKNSSALPRFTVLCALCSVAVAVVVVTTATQRNTSAVAPGNSDAKRSPDQSTLDFIRIRGSLVCGVVENPGFSIFNDTSGEWSGFEVDLVRLESLKKTTMVTYISQP